MIFDDEFISGTPEPAPTNAIYEDEDDGKDKEDEDSVFESASTDQLN